MFNKFIKMFKKKETSEADDIIKASQDSQKQNKEAEKKYSLQVDRNLKGKELEKEGKIEEAIKLYEANLKENFDGNHPYDRLAIIYRKKKLYTEEKRVLERAIIVFKDLSDERPDKEIKLNRFKDRLNKVTEKYL